MPDFQITIWDTTHTPLCPPNSRPAWRWKISVWKEGWSTREVYAEGCEETLSQAAIAAQSAIRNYHRESK